MKVLHAKVCKLQVAVLQLMGQTRTEMPSESQRSLNNERMAGMAQRLLPQAGVAESVSAHRKEGRNLRATLATVALGQLRFLRDGTQGGQLRSSQLLSWRWRSGYLGEPLKGGSILPGVPMCACTSGMLQTQQSFIPRQPTISSAVGHLQ